MLEEYYKYQKKYKDFIALIKSGNFYITFDKDAIVMNKIFKYKILGIADTIKCGFPLLALEKVQTELKEKRINYLVIDKNGVLVKKEFEGNNYKTFSASMSIIKYRLFRIKTIIKYLNDNAYEDIDDLLESIENLIDGRR